MPIGLTGDRTRIIATLALAAIIVGNELVMRNWRRVRDEELLTVEIALDEAQSARAAAEKSAAGDLPATGAATPLVRPPDGGRSDILALRAVRFARR